MDRFARLHKEAFQLWESCLFRELQPCDTEFTPANQQLLDVLVRDHHVQEDAEVFYYLKHLVPSTTIWDLRIWDNYEGLHFCSPKDILVMDKRYLKLFELPNPMVIDLESPASSTIYVVTKDRVDFFSESIEKFFACCNHMLSLDENVLDLDEFYSWPLEQQISCMNQHLESFKAIASGNEKEWLFCRFQCYLLANDDLLEQFAPADVLEAWK